MNLQTNAADDPVTIIARCRATLCVCVFVYREWIKDLLQTVHLGNELTHRWLYSKGTIKKTTQIHVQTSASENKFD